MRGSALFLMLLSASPATARAAAPAARSVLVLETRATGVPEALALSVAHEVAGIIDARPGFSAVAQQELAEVAAFEANKAALGCEEEAACLAQMSKLANAELVLSSSVGRVGETTVVSLTLVDANRAAVAGRASDTVERLEELPPVLTRLLGELFSWQGADGKRRFSLPEGRGLSFAVLDLRPAGLSPEIASSLTQVLSAGLKQVRGASVVTSEDVNAMLQLEKQKEMLGCEGDSACLAEIGGALGVDKLVTGNVAKLEQAYVISLRLIDARQVRVDNRVSESFAGEQDQLIRAVRHAGRLLLGLAPDEPGMLAVSASQEGVSVFVDEVEKGKLPMPPLANLAAGRHALRVAKPGFFDWQSNFYVEPADTTVVWAQMSERPARWYQKWWVWAIAGGAAAASGTAAILLTRPAPSSGHGSVSIQ